MKISDSFLLKNVAGKDIVVPVGKVTFDFNAIMTFNETGAFLFKKLQEKDLTEDELVKALTDEYDVSDDIAKKDVAKFVESLSNAGVLLK